MKYETFKAISQKKTSIKIKDIKMLYFLNTKIHSE